MNDIKLAEFTDFDAVVNVFKSQKKLFPHIRLDYITRMIVDSKCVFEDGVVIMFNRYKRNNPIGDVLAQKGTYTIKQIVNSNPGNGAAERVMKKFMDHVGVDIFLSVRADNTRAIRFYERNNFEKIGSIAWKQGTIPGCVFLRKGEKCLI